MAATMSPKRFVSESIPILGVTLFWAVPAELAPVGPVTDALRYAGVVMALLVAGRRGVAIAGTVPLQSPLMAFEPLLRTNGVALLAGGVWFLLALLTDVLLDLSPLQFGIFRALADALTFAMAVTGFATVVLVAVVVGKTSFDRDGRSPSGTTSSKVGVDD